MPCLCVSPLSGFSSPTLRRPHLSSPPAYRICCLLTLVHLQSARFPRRCPEAGKNSTASGLSLKPITTNTVCSLGHRRRPNPLSYCCVGGITCVDRLVSAQQSKTRGQRGTGWRSAGESTTARDTTGRESATESARALQTVETIVRTQRHRLDGNKSSIFSGGCIWRGFCRDLDPCWFD